MQTKSMYGDILIIRMIDWLTYKMFKLKCLFQGQPFEVSDTRSNTYASSWILDYFPKANMFGDTRSFSKTCGMAHRIDF